MTDTPHLEALAMRTRAAELAIDGIVMALDGEYTAQHIMRETEAAILAMPLEADPAALVAEALRLPEVRVLVEAATEQAEYLSLCGEDGDLLRNLTAALSALVQP